MKCLSVDGSLTTPLIYISKALYVMDNVSHDFAQLLSLKLRTALESYDTILRSARTDKTFVGIPKYTSKKEITHRLNLLGHEDRGFLTHILSAGEFVGPLPIQGSKYSIAKPPSDLKSIIDNVISLAGELHVIYYRPYNHIPALRLEVPRSVASSSQRIAVLLECLRSQCGPPGIMEPFPLYLADRMVKHVSKALPAIRRAATQEMMQLWEDETGDMYLAMHGYRTEQGK